MEYRKSSIVWIFQLGFFFLSILNTFDATTAAEGEENRNVKKDSNTQKKHRVVWSTDLHRKFVAAVDELGLEIFYWLQKYKVYLANLNSDSDPQSIDGEGSGNPEEIEPRKRKEQNGTGIYLDEEDEDSNAHKKPGVVWSPRLHKKFVDAVDQLGPESESKYNK
ncbi:hypothetical protein V2J09_009589 [Rumex salicifolius]